MALRPVPTAEVIRTAKEIVRSVEEWLEAELVLVEKDPSRNSRAPLVVLHLTRALNARCG